MYSKYTLFVSLILSNGFAAAESPRVYDIKHQVTYRGITLDSIEHFQNVRYGHETSGSRRFSPPEPYDPPQGTEVDATLPGHACPQIKDAMLPFFSETETMSEDCLNLRIARPIPSATTSKSKLPVVVWIHGGGVVKGSAYDPHSEPDKLVVLSQSIGKPIIFVAINYRMTAFGFARLPILEEQRSLNVGLRDQREALQWVKDHIEAFGGDPDKITVFGLSAGGTFASLHLMAYGGEQGHPNYQGVPFNQAWMMSGPPGTALNMSSDATTQHTLAVAENVGCSQSGEKQLDCLRAIPMEKLLDAAITYSVANHPPAGLFTFIPSVDGDFFPDRQSVLYRSGRLVKDIPIVLGWTQDDGAMNAGPAHLIQKEEDMIPVIRSFAHALSDDDLSRLFSMYDATDFTEDVKNYEAEKDENEPTVSIHFFRLSRILRDLLFTCSSVDFGYEMSKRSRASMQNSGVYLYALNQSMLTPLWKGAGMPHIKVSHGSDTNYLFNGLFPEGQISEDDQKLSRDFAVAFINFANSGNPGEVDGEKWPEAFSRDDAAPLESAPHSLNLEVVGGPYGTGSTLLGSGESSDEEGGEGFFDIVKDEMGGPLLVPRVSVGAMSSPSARMRKTVLDREQLLRRCEYLNSLSEKLGV